jgi:protein-disulfide isomerase
MSESTKQRRERQQQERREQREQRRVAAIQRQQRQRRLQILGGVVALAVVVAVILIALNRPATTGDLAILPSPIPAGVATDGRQLGDPGAPVTIVEYGDYQCPFCGVFAREELPMLIDEFVATGQASFAYHDLAFLGQESIDAAEAAACADDQDAFWPMHKTIFANQQGENRGAFTLDRLRSMATGLSLDTEAYDACMADDIHLEAVAAMADEAGALGINSTPTFVINGEVVRNAGYESLRATINEALGE